MTDTQVQTPGVAALLASSEAFDVPLRMGDGFDQRRFDELCHALRVCAEEWTHLESVPKVAVNVLVDLAPAVESCSYLPFYSNTEAEFIRQAAFTLSELVRDCVAVTNGLA